MVVLLTIELKRSIAYLCFGLCTAADYMACGYWREAEALVLLLIAACDQVTIDEGKWTIAWLFTHLPEPNWTDVSRKPRASMLHPYSRLLPSTWTAAASAYVKDMAALGELRKKAHVSAKAQGGKKEGEE